MAPVQGGGLLEEYRYLTEHEIDVSPVQIQGPKSAPLMEKMFGSHVREIPYYHLIHDELNGHAVTISRTGFSAEVGFEIYLHDATLHADDVWPHILEQGREFNLLFDPTKERPKSEL